MRIQYGATMGRVGVLLLASLSGGCDREGSGGGAEVGRAPRPNILVYMIDTMRRDHLGLYGYERRTTPRIDEFAKDAVVFEEAYSPSGWTKPAVASLLSGVNPPRHGAITRRSALPEDVRVLGEYLSPLGYHTAAIVTNPNIIPFWGFGQGFDAFYDVRQETRTRRVDADTVNEWVIRHLSEAAQGPFFVYIHTLDPHSPYEPPPPYDTMFTDDPSLGKASPAGLSPDTPEPVFESTLARYDGEIAFNDEQFGLLMDHLKERGLYDDALIVLVADHGEEFLDHAEAGHGHTLYSELVKVPMIIKWPGNAYAGTQARFRVGLIDLVPTVLSYLGRDLPSELEGIPLTPLLSGGGRGAPERLMYFDLDLVRAKGGTLNVSTGVLSGPYKYIEVSSPQKKRLLFDLSQDPQEQANLLGVRPDLARKLSRALAAYSAESTAGLHFRVVNGNDMQDRVIEGVLRTEGRFVGLRKMQLEQDDQADLEASGKTITFRFKLFNRPHPTAGKPKWLVDEEQLSFRVDPPDADVIVERLVCQGGEDWPLFVGPAKRRVESLPVVFKPGDIELATASLSGLFRRHGQPSYSAGMGAYLLVIAPPEREEVPMEDVPADVLERLRALGYVGGDEGAAAAGEDDGAAGADQDEKDASSE